MSSASAALRCLLASLFVSLARCEEAASLAELISQIHADEPRHQGWRPVEPEQTIPPLPLQVDDAVGGSEAGEAGEGEEEDTHHATWMKSGKFQGDIAGIDPRYGVPVYMSPDKEFSNDGRQYNAIRNRNLRWKGGKVPYVLASTYTAREKAVITRAMEKYHKETCVRFVPRTRERDYLFIVKSYGCYSQVGKVRGRQELSLGNGCIYHEIAVHELMHALGFWHEHSRADRDQFIRIQWRNIIGGMRGQFDKISTAYQDFLGETYDYKSVMHYDSRAFSKNGQNTIETVKAGFTQVIGRAKDLSEVDIRKVNKLYQCPARPTSGGGRKLPPPSTTTTPRPTVRTQRPRTSRPEPVTAKPLPPSGGGDKGKGGPGGPGGPISPGPGDKSVGGSGECTDKFLDCPFFHRYCFRRSFFFIMKLYCPKTCGHCVTQGNTIVLGPSSFRARHRYRVQHQEARPAPKLRAVWTQPRRQPQSQPSRARQSQPTRQQSGAFSSMFGSFFG